VELVTEVTTLDASIIPEFIEGLLEERKMEYLGFL
jgi:hypothetical protein